MPKSQKLKKQAWTDKSDDLYDTKRHIKEGSTKDAKLDAKRGVIEDDAVTKMHMAPMPANTQSKLLKVSKAKSIVSKYETNRRK